MILIEKVTQHGLLTGYNTEGILVARECSKCREYLPRTEFCNNKNFKTGCNSVCKTCERADKKNRYPTDGHLYRRRSKEYAKSKPEQARATRLKCWEKNGESYKAVAKIWRLNNPAKAAFSPMKRVRKLGEACILKNNKLAMSEMDSIYSKARMLRQTTDIVYEVDHIIPLQNENICGLHVPKNLQILERFSNRSKSDKFDGTYENESWKKDIK